MEPSCELLKNELSAVAATGRFLVVQRLPSLLFYLVNFSQDVGVGEQGVLPACLSVPVEDVELWAVVNHRVVAGSPTGVLWLKTNALYC